MNEPILILGASVRAAAQSAKRANFAPHGIDCFADEDLRSLGPATAISKYPEEFLSAVATIPPMRWFYAGGLENHPALVDRIAERHTLLGNPGDVLRRIRDPRRLSGSLRDAGFCSPRVQSSSTAPTTENFSYRDFAWLRKPYRSGGGIGIEFLRNDFSQSLGNTRSHYLQEYIDGTPVSAVFVGIGKSAFLLGITEQLIGCDWAGGNGFQFCGSIGPLRLPKSLECEMLLIGQFLAREFQLCGLFGIDAVIAKNRVWTIEVNPRYTASVEVLERSLGSSLVSAHAAACEGVLDHKIFAEQTSNIWGKEFNSYIGKAILYATHDLVIEPWFSEFARQANGDAPWPVIADIPSLGAKVFQGEPIVSVFAETTNHHDVVHSLQKIASQVFSLFESGGPS